MHPATVIVSKALPAIALGLRHSIRDTAGEDIPFMLIIFTPEVLSYYSTAPHDVSVPALRHFFECVDSNNEKITQEQRDAFKPSHARAVSIMLPAVKSMADTLKFISGEDLALALFFFTNVRASYVANGSRDECFPVIRALLEDMANGMPDIPAHHIAMH
ncbi:MAG: hypothetical protein JWL63_3237 [Rhodocyclales bacterium]|nr:hypothetical protein [Rhodocyclales bacterium]